MTSVPGTPWQGPLPALTPAERDLAARLRGHVTAIASKLHSIGHPAGYAAAFAYIERELTGQGYAVT